MLGLTKVFNTVSSFATRMRASYFEGARVSTATRQFHRASNRPYEELAQQERGILRARARWLKSNNPIMSNIDKSLVNNISRGMYIRLENNKLRKRFDEWCKTCDVTGRSNLYEIINMVIESRFVDGEAFIYKSFDKTGLKLKVFEPEQIDESKGVNGLELGEDGSVLAYWIFNTNTKADFKGYSSFNSEKIKSDRIINFFRQERESQYRGISEYARATLDIKNMAAFMSTSIESMRARATIAYAVKTEGNPNGFGVNQDEVQEINNAMVHYLRVGESISALDAPTTPINYQEFITAGMRSLCVSRQVSYEFGFRDFSNVNFTSSRAGKIEDGKTIEADQILAEDRLINPIMAAYFEAEYLLGNIKSPIDPLFEVILPRREWVRPNEDLEYQLNLIKEGLSTKEALCRQTTGDSYENTLKKRRKELELEEHILGDYRMLDDDNMLLGDLKKKRLEENAKQLKEENNDD